MRGLAFVFSIVLLIKYFAGAILARMYYPFLHGKLNEILAVGALDGSVWSRITPVIEPMQDTETENKHLKRLLRNRRRFVLMTNPTFGEYVGNRPIPYRFVGYNSMDSPHLILGFSIRKSTRLDSLRAFLAKYAHKKKFVYFRGLPNSFQDMVTLLQEYQTSTIAFDSTLGPRILPVFSEFKDKVVMRDGFKRQSRNSDYPSMSEFSSYALIFRERGLTGFGDYCIVGDYEADPQGYKPKVVTLHFTVQDGQQLFVYHFSSKWQSDRSGDGPLKLVEACKTLVASTQFESVISTSGKRLLKDLANSGLRAGLGTAKKMTLQHHMELMANLHTEHIPDLFGN